MDYTKDVEILAPTLRYEEARELIQDGDLLTFRSKDDSVLHRAVRLVTKSSYFHSGVAVWLKSRGSAPRLFVAESQRTGRRLVPLSCYANHKFGFEVVACPVPFEAFENTLMADVGSTPYSVMDFVGIGLRILFGITLKDTQGEVCSELVQKLYASGGFPVPNFILAPNELLNYVLTHGAVARARVAVF